LNDNIFVLAEDFQQLAHQPAPATGRIPLEKGEGERGPRPYYHPEKRIVNGPAEIVRGFVIRRLTSRTLGCHAHACVGMMGKRCLTERTCPRKRGHGTQPLYPAIIPLQNTSIASQLDFRVECDYPRRGITLGSRKTRCPITKSIVSN
jgi:hypothetical protein